MITEVLHIRRRIEGFGGHELGKSELCFEGEVGGGHEHIIFQEPLSDIKKLASVRQELKNI
jgi:hypothetical protein